MKLTDGDYHVYLVKLPGCIRGAVRVDIDGYASIYINSLLSPKARTAVLRHELRHVTRNDHTSNASIQEVEGCQE